MKKVNRLAVLATISTVALTLSGCVRTTKSGRPYGFVYDYLAQPAQSLMEWMAHFLGGYGWAIIALTVIVRMLLLPIMVRQMRSSTVQQEKMAMVRPQLNEIQKRQKTAKTKEEQAAVSSAMMALYRKNGISMTGGIGCLPLLIQMPVFAALYAAIRYSPELSHTVFMGIKLGQSSWILAALSFATYLLQGYIGMLGAPKEQKKQMRSMMLLSPVMILLFTMTAPAGLGIYFFIGGVFACIQTLIINLYRPGIRRDVKSKMEGSKAVSVDELIAQATPTSATAASKNDTQPNSNDPDSPHPTSKNRQRNAGKQQHHKNN